MPRHALSAVLAAVLAATTLTGAAAANPRAGTVPNGAFAKGKVGWTAQPAHRARLTVSRQGQRGPKALRVRAASHGQVAVRTARPVRLRSTRGARQVVRAWVRSNRTGHRARLVVRERKNGSVVQRKQRTVRLKKGRWTRINLPLRTARKNSRLMVTVMSPWQRPRDVLLLDRVRVATPKGAASPGAASSRACSINSRGVPGCGTYLGAAYGANTDPTAWERELGGKLALRRTYFRADQVAGAVRHARTDLAQGRLPWISFKLPHGWEQMAAGAGDAWARDLARQLATLDGPVWVAFHHEPEGDGDILAWRRMQERLGPLVRSAGDNIGFTVVVTGWHQFYGASEFRLANMWPRGITVDVAGFDVYNSLGVVKNGTENTKGTDLRTAYFTKIKAWADAEGVAWGLAETGYTDKAASVDPTWIARTYGEMEAMGGVAFAYFNTTLNSIAPWHISAGTKQADFSRALKGTLRLPR